MEKIFSTANDNAPAAPGRAQIGLNATEPLRHRRVTERPSMIVSQTLSPGTYTPVWTPKIQRAKPAEPKPVSSAVYTLAAMAWVTAVLANIAALLFAPINTVHLFIVIAAIWTALFMIWVAQSRGQTVLAEMASLSAIAAFGLSIYITSMRFGIASSPATGAALGAFAAAALGLITGSKLALRLSAFTALAWAVITLTGPGLDLTGAMSGGLPKPGPAWLAFPALLGLQGFAGARHKDGAALSISVLAAYVLAAGGLAGYVMAGQLSPVIAAGAFLLGGLLHSRIGKLAGRRQSFGSALHTGAGTAAMLAGLIALQDFWTRPDRAIWSGADVSGAQWPAGLAAGAALLSMIWIFDAARERISFARLMKSALLCALAGGLIYVSARPGSVAGPLSDYGLSAVPWAGVALAGTVLALGLGFMANGFRRHLSSFVAIGAIAIAGSVFSALPAIMLSAETGLVYGVSAFISALIAASFVSTSPAPQTSPVPYAGSYAND